MRRIAVSIGLLLAMPAACQDLINADRPGIADSSAVVGKQVVQVEAGIERDDAGNSRNLLTPFLIRYGLTSALELRAEGNGYQRARDSGDTESGLAAVSLGFKYHLASPSLGVIVRAFLPSGSGPFRTHDTTGDIRAAWDFDFGSHWSINPNVGVMFGEQFTAATAAITGQYNISDKLGTFVDGAVQSPEERHGSTSLLIDTGVAWIVGSKTQLDTTIGWGARGSSTPNVFFSAGISRRN